MRCILKTRTRISHRDTEKDRRQKAEGRQPALNSTRLPSAFCFLLSSSLCLCVSVASSVCHLLLNGADKACGVAESADYRLWSGVGQHVSGCGEHGQV